MRIPGADGNTLAVTEWPGDPASSVLAVHATGLCKGVWEPVAALLSAAGIRLVAIDQRGHGGSSQFTGTADWWGLGRDAARAAAELGPFLAGLGHSSGATALSMASLLEPGLLPGLVLIEPVVFPPGAGYDDGLARAAARRRSRFADHNEARAHFAGRGMFAGWVPEALDGYLSCGLTPDAEGLRLSCPPEVEAEFYEMGTEHGLWSRLDDLAVPVTLLAGSDSLHHSQPVLDALAARYRASLRVIDGADHFLPMQAPAAVAGAVGDSLATGGRALPS